MPSGIVRLVDGRASQWAPIHEGNRCVVFFGASDIPDPLPSEFEYADSLESARTPLQLKEIEVAQWFASVIAAGYDTGMGFSVRIEETDQRFWMDMLVGLERMIARGVSASSPYSVKDVNGVVHAVTMQQAIDLADGGFVYVGQLYGLKFQYEAEIAAGRLGFTVGLPLIAED